MNQYNTVLTKAQGRALPDRQKCRLMVQKLSELTSKSEAQIWGLAYHLLGKQMRVDVKEKARAAGIAPLAWVDDQRRMAQLKRCLLQIHRDWQNPPRRARRGGQR
jgi:hypothetical protein